MDRSRWTSRKFWVVIITAVAAVWSVVTDTEVDPQTAIAAATIIATWLGIQGWADKAEAASGISFERQLFQANMQAAYAQFEQLSGASEVGNVQQFPNDVVFTAEQDQEFPPPRLVEDPAVWADDDNDTIGPVPA